MANFIPDGFNIEGYIEADEKGEHDACRFTFRRCLKAAVSRAFVSNDATADIRASAEAAELVKHLVKWDIRDNKGKPAEITEQVLLNNIPIPLFNSLRDIVIYGEPSDKCPDFTADQTADAAESGEAAAKN